MPNSRILDDRLDTSEIEAVQKLTKKIKLVKIFGAYNRQSIFFKKH